MSNEIKIPAGLYRELEITVFPKLSITTASINLLGWMKDDEDIESVETDYEITGECNGNVQSYSDEEAVLGLKIVQQSFYTIGGDIPQVTENSPSRNEILRCKFELLKQGTEFKVTSGGSGEKIDAEKLRLFGYGKLIVNNINTTALPIDTQNSLAAVSYDNNYVDINFNSLQVGSSMQLRYSNTRLFGSYEYFYVRMEWENSSGNYTGVSEFFIDKDRKTYNYNLGTSGDYINFSYRKCILSLYAINDSSLYNNLYTLRNQLTGIPSINRLSQFNSLLADDSKVAKVGEAELAMRPVQLVRLDMSLYTNRQGNSNLRIALSFTGIQNAYKMHVSLYLYQMLQGVENPVLIELNNSFRAIELINGQALIDVYIKDQRIRERVLNDYKSHPTTFFGAVNFHDDAPRNMFAYDTLKYLLFNEVSLKTGEGNCLRTAYATPSTPTEPFTYIPEKLELTSLKLSVYGYGSDKYMYFESDFIRAVNDPQITTEIRLYERKSYPGVTLYEEVPLQNTDYTLNITNNGSMDSGRALVQLKPQAHDRVIMDFQRNSGKFFAVMKINNQFDFEDSKFKRFTPGSSTPTPPSYSDRGEYLAT